MVRGWSDQSINLYSSSNHAKETKSNWIAWKNVGMSTIPSNLSSMAFFINWWSCNTTNPMRSWKVQISANGWYCKISSQPCYLKLGGQGELYAAPFSFSICNTSSLSSSLLGEFELELASEAGADATRTRRRAAVNLASGHLAVIGLGPVHNAMRPPFPSSETNWICPNRKQQIMQSNSAALGWTDRDSFSRTYALWSNLNNTTANISSLINHYLFK